MILMPRVAATLLLIAALLPQRGTSDFIYDDFNTTTGLVMNGDATTSSCDPGLPENNVYAYNERHNVSDWSNVRRSEGGAVAVCGVRESRVSAGDGDVYCIRVLPASAAVSAPARASPHVARRRRVCALPRCHAHPTHASPPPYS